MDELEETFRRLTFGGAEDHDVVGVPSAGNEEPDGAGPPEREERRD